MKRKIIFRIYFYGLNICNLIDALVYLVTFSLYTPNLARYYIMFTSKKIIKKLFDNEKEK